MHAAFCNCNEHAYYKCTNTNGTHEITDDGVHQSRPRVISISVPASRSTYLPFAAPQRTQGPAGLYSEQAGNHHLTHHPREGLWSKAIHRCLRQGTASIPAANVM